jgi:glucose-fructose oxidoreductase
MKRKWRVAGINFDHMHMGDLLRMVNEHPEAEVVGICDKKPSRMQLTIRMLAISAEAVFIDPHQCVEKTRPDFILICPATARHAEYVETLAPYRKHLLVEKPFAASLAEADRMIAAARKHEIMLAINWPLRWVPSHCTAYRLLNEGLIGELQEVHFYDGNRGPLWHTAGKTETKPTPAVKRASWFYKRKQGGGSLLDYLGYGTTLGTWYHAERRPFEVTTVVNRPKGLEVDEHSVTIARYACGLSKFETRWGTFTDPWKHQPQPKCGFVLKGTEGTISSYDYEPTIRVQTEKQPEGYSVDSDLLRAPFQNPIQYFIHCIQRGHPPEGPLSTKVSRIGQQIVDAAILSARLRRTVPLPS